MLLKVLGFLLVLSYVASFLNLESSFNRKCISATRKELNPVVRESLIATLFPIIWHIYVFQSNLDETKNVVSKLANIAGYAVLATTSVIVAPALAAETATKPRKPKVLETENGIKYIEVKKGDGAYPNDGMTMLYCLSELWFLNRNSQAISSS